MADGRCPLPANLRRPGARPSLTIARLRAGRPDLSPLLLKGFQAASFPIPKADFHVVLDLLGEDPEALPRAPVLPPGTLEELAILEQQYLQAAPETKERISRAVERGPIGALVKRLNGYRCQVCEALGLDAIGFIKPDGEPYVEAHHVTPVAERQVGGLAAANVITVCANHHRQLHYGGGRVEVDEGSFRFGLPEGSIEIARLRLPSVSASPIVISPRVCAPTVRLVGSGRVLASRPAKVP